MCVCVGGGDKFMKHIRDGGGGRWEQNRDGGSPSGKTMREDVTFCKK